jgi:CrcB protein
LNKYILIMLGGAVGSLCRYQMQGWAQTWISGTFPIGTLLVNVIGCFLIGALNTAFTGPFPIRPEYRIGIVVGILGGFTTFSAFGWETLALADDGQRTGATMNIVLSVLLGLVAVWAGSRLTQRLYGV